MAAQVNPLWKKMSWTNNLTIYPNWRQTDDRRWGVFFDCAGVWDDLSSFDIEDMRASVGVAMVMRTPVAPFVFSYGYQLRNVQVMRSTVFSFQGIGLVFKGEHHACLNGKV